MVAEHLVGRAELEECLKDQLDGVLYLLIGILVDVSRLQSEQSDGKGQRQLASLGLVEHACLEPTAERVQLDLADDSLHAQQQPAVDRSGIVDPISICDQTLSQGTDIQQRIPVAAITRQARALVAEHDAHAS